MRAGIITDTVGRCASVSIAAIVTKSTARIYYYSCVPRYMPRSSSLAAVDSQPCLLLPAALLCRLATPARGRRALGPTLQISLCKIPIVPSTLNQFHGQIVVLNFWATWCPPCVEEMPSLVEMQRQMKAKGVTVLAVSIDVDENAYRAFLKQHGVDLLTVRDPAQKTPALYGTHGWPETFIIDRNGMMRRKFIGAVDWTEPEITDYLSKL